MDYRHDILRWQLERTGETYGQLSKTTGLSKSTLWAAVKGDIDPTISTIRKTFQALNLDPKYAMDFRLRKSEFRRAVVETAR